MDWGKLFRAKAFSAMLIGIGFFVVLLLIFKVGVAVGFRKANFSYRWGENYHRNFAGPRGGFLKNLRDEDFIEAHGTFGSILKIDGQELIVSGRGGTEKTVIVREETILRQFRDTIKLSDLKVGDYVVVVGSPNDDGRIEAKLIRLMPAPMGGPPRPLPFQHMRMRPI